MLLAWEQGTGKTVISIAACEKLFELGKAKNALVICPNALTWQWANKIREFSDARVHMVSASDPDSRRYKKVPRGYVVVPYSLFRRDYPLGNILFDIVIADEAQEFKNFSSVTAKYIKRKQFGSVPTYRWALTGTAIGNKLEELYSIFQWVDRKFLPPWPTFEQRHIVRNSYGAIASYKNLEVLNLYLQKRMDRKTHADMKGQMPTLMPPVFHKIKQSKENKEAQVKLQGELDKFRGEVYIDNAGNIKGFKKDSKLPSLFHKVKESTCSEDKLKYAKYLADKILEENETNKVIIFSFYKDPLYDLHTEFCGEAALFTGDQSILEKQQSVERLESGQSRCLLASNAGKAGLDLPSANYVIHLDVPFSHEVLDQRNKRITRASSVHDTANINYLIMENSVEEFYYELVLNKGKLADAVLEGTQNSVAMKSQSLRQFLSNGRHSDKDKDISRVRATDKATTNKKRPTKQRNKRRTYSKRS